jgi:hypothetical protein
MSVAEKIDYSLIPVIDVARELLGQETGGRTTANDKHFDDRGGLFVNLKKNKWYCHGESTGGMLSPSYASPPAAIIKAPSIGCGRMDMSRFSASGRHLSRPSRSTTTRTRTARASIRSFASSRRTFANAAQTATAAGSGKAQRGQSLTSCPN